MKKRFSAVFVLVALLAALLFPTTASARLAPPIATDITVSDLTPTSATLSFDVVPHDVVEDRLPWVEAGIQYRLSSSENFGVVTSVLMPDGYTGDTYTITASLTGLIPGASYSIQSYITTDEASYTPSEKIFTTPLVAPTVTTNDAADIKVYSASVSASVAQDATPAYRGVITDYGFIIDGVKTSEGVNADVTSFAHDFTDLAPRTTIVYQAYVTVDGKDILGAEKSFTTKRLSTAYDEDDFVLIPGSYTIYASSGVGGSISPSGANSVASGGALSFAMTPDAGYNIAAVTIDGVNVGAVGEYEYTNVSANHSIYVSFARIDGAGAVTVPDAGLLPSTGVGAATLLSLGLLAAGCLIFPRKRRSK